MALRFEFGGAIRQDFFICFWVAHSGGGRGCDGGFWSRCGGGFFSGGCSGFVGFVDGGGGGFCS